MITQLPCGHQMNARVDGLGEVFPLLKYGLHIRQYECGQAHGISFGEAIQAPEGKKMKSNGVQDTSDGLKDYLEPMWPTQPLLSIIPKHEYSPPPARWRPLPA